MGKAERCFLKKVAIRNHLLIRIEFLNFGFRMRLRFAKQVGDEETNVCATDVV